MSIKQLLFCSLFIFAVSAISFGQKPPADNGDFSEPVGDTGEKEAAKRAEFLIKLHNYNAQVNTDVALKKLYHHHIDVNETLKDLGGGKVTQNIDFYFERKVNGFMLKKVLILTNLGSTQSYEDILFDNTGEVSYYSLNADINNKKSKKTGYYFTTKTLLYYSEDGLVLAKNEYGTDIFQNGVDVLNKAEDYKLLMQTLTRVHPKG